LCASLALADSLLRVIAKPELGVQMIARSAFIARDPLYLVCDVFDQGLSFSLSLWGLARALHASLFARFVILAMTPRAAKRPCLWGSAAASGHICGRLHLQTTPPACRNCPGMCLLIGCYDRLGCFFHFLIDSLNRCE
jgi:hypothetical protein